MPHCAVLYRPGNLNVRTFSHAQVFLPLPSVWLPFPKEEHSDTHTSAFHGAGKSTRPAPPGGSCPWAPRHTLLPGMLRGHAKQEGGARGGASPPAQGGPHEPFPHGPRRDRRYRRQFIGTLGARGRPAHLPLSSAPPGRRAPEEKGELSKGRAHACSRGLPSVSQSVSQSLLSGSPPAAAAVAATRARSLTFRLVFGGHFPSARHILLHRLLLATGTRQARAPLPLPPPPPLLLLSARLFLLLLLPLLPLPLPPLLLTLPCRRGPSCCGRRFLLHHYHNHHHRAGRRARAASSHTPRASHWPRECTDAPADQPPLAGGGPEERMGLTDSAHGLRAVGSAGGRDKRGEAYRRRSNGHDCREGVWGTEAASADGGGGGQWDPKTGRRYLLWQLPQPLAKRGESAAAGEAGEGGDANRRPANGVAAAQRWTQRGMRANGEGAGPKAGSEANPLIGQWPWRATAPLLTPLTLNKGADWRRRAPRPIIEARGGSSALIGRVGGFLRGPLPGVLFPPLRLQLWFGLGEVRARLGPGGFALSAAQQRQWDQSRFVSACLAIDEVAPGGVLGRLAGQRKGSRVSRADCTGGSRHVPEYGEQLIAQAAVSWESRLLSHSERVIIIQCYLIEAH